MGTTGDLYRTLLVLHILTVIVGFGGVALNGLYGVQAKKRRGPEGLAIAETNYFVSTKAAEPAIYLAFVLGVLLVLTSDDAWSFGDLWVSLSMGLYVVAVGLTHGLLIPSVRRMNALMAEMVAAGPPAGGSPPQVAELEQRGKTVGMVGALNNVFLVVILALMIWKPT